MHRNQLIYDDKLLKVNGHALYEIVCTCIYNGYEINSAKLFIHQHGIEYIDCDKFSYFGFLSFSNIISENLVEKQLQLNCNLLDKMVVLAFESENLLDLQLIYEACISNSVNFDDSFILSCTNID